MAMGTLSTAGRRDRPTSTSCSPICPHFAGSMDRVESGGETATMTRVAVLDDYQRRASGYADWASLGEDVEVVFFHETIEQDALVGTLADFEVLV